VSCVAKGVATFTINSESRNLVTTMKKNNNMKTISGNEAVLIAGWGFFFPFENFDIVNHFAPIRNGKMR
jgi:hypothetical protein